MPPRPVLVPNATLFHRDIHSFAESWSRIFSRSTNHDGVSKFLLQIIQVSCIAIKQTVFLHCDFGHANPNFSLVGATDLSIAKQWKISFQTTPCATLRAVDTTTIIKKKFLQTVSQWLLNFCYWCIKMFPQEFLGTCFVYRINTSTVLVFWEPAYRLKASCSVLWHQKLTRS